MNFKIVLIRLELEMVDKVVEKRGCCIRISFPLCCLSYGVFWVGNRQVLTYLFAWIGLVGLVGWCSCQVISHSINYHFSAPTLIHGARISGLEARMDQVEDRICDLDARGSEEADNLANDRDLDRFILTGN